MTSLDLDQDTDLQKFIAFPVADHALALPSKNVLRVLRHGPSDRDDELNRLGLLQIGSHVIRVLNLHQWLTPTPSLSLSTPQPFLIIARSPEWEPFGIWTDGLPDLVELSPDLLRSLPPSVSASSHFLELISHTAVVPDEEGNKTIFLLNLSHVLNARAPEVAALPPQA